MTPQRGTVYTETVVYSAPTVYVNDAPYQIAIVDLESGRRTTVRIRGDRVRIGDHVTLAEMRDNVPYFERSV